MNISCNSCHVFIHLISLMYTVELFALLVPHVWLMFKTRILEGPNEQIIRKTGYFIHSAFIH